MTFRESEDDANQFLLAPKKRRSLSEVEWGMAFDIYIAVYTQKFPDQLPAILTYSRHVKDLMKYRVNWRFYFAGEFNPHPWSVIRQDLELRAFRSKPQSNGYNSFTSQFNQDRVPKGFCFSFHRKGGSCQFANCSYKHTCPRCQRKHPAHQPCNGTKQFNTSNSDKRQGFESSIERVPK